MSKDGILIANVEDCVIWTVPVRNSVKSAPFTIRGMKSYLNFCAGWCLKSDYRLYLYSDCKPAEPFEVSVHVSVGQEEAFHGRTTFPARYNIIWSGTKSELSRTMVPDIKQFLFRIVLFGNSTEEAKPPLTSLSARTPSYHTEALSRDFGKLLDGGGSSCDVQISCGGRVFEAHRIVLGVRSEVFAAMLESKMAEGHSGRVDIRDVDGDVFEQFLRYLYSGAPPDLSPDSAKALYEVADKYAVEELRRACASFLCCGLEKDNVCDVLVLSDRHGDLEFKDAIIQFMIREKIPRTFENWLEFCDRHPKLANDVLNRCCEKLFDV